MGRLSLENLDSLRPSWGLLCTLVLVSYFLVTAGIAYDMINEPPAIGGHPDPVTGVVRPVAFMPYRMNGQYIFEGLCGGFMYTLGGVGIIMLDLSRNKNTSSIFRQFYLMVGTASVVLSYLACTSFIRIKMPGYLR